MSLYVAWSGLDTTPPGQGGLVFEAYRLLYHSTLGLRVIKKKKAPITRSCQGTPVEAGYYSLGPGTHLPSPIKTCTCECDLFPTSSSSVLLSSLELSDTQVYEPYIRALLGTDSHFCEVVVLTLRTVPIGTDPSLRIVRVIRRDAGHRPTPLSEF